MSCSPHQSSPRIIVFKAEILGFARLNMHDSADASEIERGALESIFLDYSRRQARPIAADAGFARASAVWPESGARRGMCARNSRPLRQTFRNHDRRAHIPRLLPKTRTEEDIDAGALVRLNSEPVSRD
jgi:hypothetical protein